MSQSSVFFGYGQLIPDIVTNEAHVGDYFQQQSGDTEAQAVLDASFFAGSGFVPDDWSTLDQMIVAVAGDSANQYLDQNAQKFLGIFVPQNGGMTIESTAISTTGSNYLWALQQQEALFLGGIPQASANMAAAYADDIQRRFNGNLIVLNAMAQQQFYLDDLYNASLSQQNNSIFSTAGPVAVDAGAILVAQFVPGVDVAVDLSLVTIGELQNYARYTSDENVVAAAQHSLLAAWSYSGQIYSNNMSEYSQMFQRVSPSPVTGAILDASTSEMGYYWQGVPWANPFLVVTKASSTVTITNTSANAATFEGFALYKSPNTALGINIDCVSVGQVNIQPNQTAQMVIQYYDGNNGCAPGTNEVQIQVAGIANSAIYSVDTANSSPIVQTQSMSFAAKSNVPVPLWDGRLSRSI
jgi:hypothetical protein